MRKQVRRLTDRAGMLPVTATDRMLNGKRLEEYRDDPEGYARHVLKLNPGLTADQLELCRLITTPPYRVLCRAGHVVGKSFASAFIVSWLYDTRPECVIITTAPTFEGVKDILWRELRRLRRRAGLGGFVGPKACRMESGDSHFAVGITARDATAFQGKHDLTVFIVIDEAVGVETDFWTAIETMLTGHEHGLLAIYNPTTTGCQAYQEEQEGTEVNGVWRPRSHIHVISSLDHPNIHAELRGEPPPYPAAIRLSTVRTWISKWCDKLSHGDKPTEHDFEFPKGSGSWYRPGPIMEARGLGRWPRRGVNTIWSEALFDRCAANRKDILPHWRTAIGCDVARYGDDLTEIIVRRGVCIVHHESHSGWDGNQIAGRLKQLCHEHQGPEDARLVRVYVDDTGGWGTSVIDAAGEYHFIPVNASCKAEQEDEYDGLRTELWFAAQEIAKAGHADFSRLPSESRKELKRQLLAQKYKFQRDGRLYALPKDEIKKELGRSPDTADALNLAFLVDYEPTHESRVVA